MTPTDFVVLVGKLKAHGLQSIKLDGEGYFEATFFEPVALDHVALMEQTAERTKEELLAKMPQGERERMNKALEEELLYGSS